MTDTLAADINELMGAGAARWRAQLLRGQGLSRLDTRKSPV